MSRLWPEIGQRLGAQAAIKDLASGRYEWVDPALSLALGHDGDGMSGLTDAECFDASTATLLRSADKTAAGHGGVLASDHHFERGGRRHDYVVLRLADAPADGTPQRLACVWIDQQPLRQRQQQMQQALEQLEQLQRANEALRRDLGDSSLRDGDSGLYTRGHFEDQLRREVDLSTREHREFALVLLQIDPPADAVRALGPAAMSRVHETMGRLLRGNTRAMDASCRYDESRFAVLLSGVGLATAHSRMEGLRRQCATQIVVHEGKDLGFSVAMGVASFPHTAHTQDELVSASDAALEEAKRRGGNHVTLASIRFES
ncbi:MAG: diguanylate cyclase [Rubrivivax sp.]|nr:diguanylate cyclase [Rubrivivax sp.]MDH5338815.1 diguanylate cyclase [Rubrivivax sp.]